MDNQRTLSIWAGVPGGMNVMTGQIRPTTISDSSFDNSVKWAVYGMVKAWATPEQLMQKYPNLNGKRKDVVGMVSDITNGSWLDEIHNHYTGFSNTLKNDVFNYLHTQSTQAQQPAQQTTEAEPQSVQWGTFANAARKLSSAINLWTAGETIVNPLGSLANWINNLVQKIPTLTQNEWNERVDAHLNPTGKEWGWLFHWMWAVPTMIVNAIPSLLKTISGMWSAILNPVDTAAGIFTLVATPEWHQMLADRYGSREALGKTMTEDPVWLASDIASVAAWWAGLLKWAASVWSLWAKAAWLWEMATKLWWVASKAWEFSKLAWEAATLWTYTPIKKWLWMLWEASKFAEWDTLATKAIKSVGKYAVATAQPLKTLKSVWGKELLTRKIPLSRIAKDLWLTPTERSKLESIGKPWEQIILEKNLWWQPKHVQAQEMWNLADTNYNRITQLVEPITERVSSKYAPKMLQVMIDEMNKSNIIKEAMPEYIAELERLKWQSDFSATELNSIKRDFDRIVGNKIYDAQWRVSAMEDKVLSDYREWAYKELQELASKNGIDIKAMNDEMRAAVILRNGLLRRLSQEQKNFTFWLQDIGVWAILWHGEPISAVWVMLAKKWLEKAVPQLSQMLYNLNKTPYVSPNLKRGVPITPVDTTNRMSITPRSAAGVTTPWEPIVNKKWPLAEFQKQMAELPADKIVKKWTDFFLYDVWDIGWYKYFYIDANIPNYVPLKKWGLEVIKKVDENLYNRIKKNLWDLEI